MPAVVSNITVPLLGLCDTAIAGHLGTVSYLGAIAVGAMMVNPVFWLFGFCEWAHQDLRHRPSEPITVPSCNGSSHKA